VTAPQVWSFTVFGMPRTKKTSDEFGFPGGKFTKFPAKEWRRWVKQARIEWQTPQPVLPIRGFVTCRALFFLTARQRGDSHGYYQGLADFLENRGIPDIKGGHGLLVNDYLIADWDGSRGPWHSRSYISRDNPRVEVLLTAIPFVVD